MKIQDYYTIKRKHDKKNHKYNLIVIDNATGKKIGKGKWHGTNQKGKSNNIIEEKNIVRKHYEKLSNSEMKEQLEIYKKEGYIIPNYSKYSLNNLGFPFEYEIELNVIDKNEKKRKDYITICDDKPLTQDELNARINKRIEEGKAVNAKKYDVTVKSFKCKKLYLKKGGYYEKSYKIKKKTKKKK